MAIIALGRTETIASLGWRTVESRSIVIERSIDGIVCIHCLT